MPFNHLILYRPLLLLPSVLPSIRVVSNESVSTSSGHSIGVSASTSVLPMNTQDWFPLGWTGWTSLQSKGLSRVFSNNKVQSISSSVFSFLYSPNLTSKSSTDNNKSKNFFFFLIRGLIKEPLWTRQSEWNSYFIFHFFLFKVENI